MKIDCPYYIHYTYSRVNIVKKYLCVYKTLLRFLFFVALPCLPSLLYGVFKSRGNEANCWAYPSDEVTRPARPTPQMR